MVHDGKTPGTSNSISSGPVFSHGLGDMHGLTITFSPARLLPRINDTP